MSVIAVIGAQWGDEGKGKVVDLLARRVDMVVRYQGGNNAGHTLVVDGEKTVLHLVPSGVLHTGRICVISAGVVIDPNGLMRELDALSKGGIETAGRIFVSSRAQLVLPTHKRLDQAREELRGAKKIGTTGRGIGPAYEDVVKRSGIRCYEVLDEDRFIERVRVHVAEVNQFLESHELRVMDAEVLLEEIMPACRRMAHLVIDTGAYLRHSYARGEQILCEGAQGTMLDVIHGTYPFVTSSRVGVGGLLSGTGLNHKAIRRVICVAKAYTTRVGSGPFPTELNCEVGEGLRERGDEFGATTGRPRRCGWLDLVVVRYACQLNGADSLNLTKLDILSGMGKLQVCVGYTLDGLEVEGISVDPEIYARVEPIYEELQGWEDDVSVCASFHELPQAARDYIAFIERFTGVSVEYIGVGPGRDQMIVRS